MNELKSQSSRRISRFKILILMVVVVYFGLVILGVVSNPFIIRNSFINRLTRPAQIAKARTEMTGIFLAIQQYITIYGRPPVSRTARSSRNAASPDFTFGTVDHGTSLLNGRTHQPLPAITNANGTGYQAANSEIMTILMNLDTGPNTNHACNPQRIVFLTAKLVDNVSSSGVGPDHVFRDPWATRTSSPLISMTTA
jgi:hypothetical protein